jgi:hypothetical protein
VHRPCLLDDPGQEVAEVTGVVQARQLVGDGQLLEPVVPVLERDHLSDEVGHLRQRVAGGALVLTRLQGEEERARFFAVAADRLG